MEKRALSLVHCFCCYCDRLLFWAAQMGTKITESHDIPMLNMCLYMFQNSRKYTYHSCCCYAHLGHLMMGVATMEAASMLVNDVRP